MRTKLRNSIRMLSLPKLASGQPRAKKTLNFRKMSMPVIRSLTNAMSRCSVISRRSLLSIHRTRPSVLCTGASQTHRTLTRSLWHMSRSTTCDTKIVTKPVNHHSPCSCGCGLHTQGKWEGFYYRRRGWEIQIDQVLSTLHSHRPVGLIVEVVRGRGLWHMKSADMRLWGPSLAWADC